MSEQPGQQPMPPEGDKWDKFIRKINKRRDDKAGNFLANKQSKKRSVEEEDAAKKESVEMGTLEYLFKNYKEAKEEDIIKLHEIFARYPQPSLNVMSSTIDSLIHDANMDDETDFLRDLKKYWERAYSVSFLIDTCAEKEEGKTVDELEGLLSKDIKLKLMIKIKIDSSIEEMERRNNDAREGIAPVFNFPSKIRALKNVKKHFKKSIWED